MEPGQEPGATVVPEKGGGGRALGRGDGDQGNRDPHAVKSLRFARGHRVVQGDPRWRDFLRDTHNDRRQSSQLPIPQRTCSGQQ